MPLQNRVLPTGEIQAIPARGTMTGNRGIIHHVDRKLGTSRWSHKAWICCVLDWQDRKRDVMVGRKWTELFFLDEAVAMAAGHRPCGYCRRADYNLFCDAWTAAYGTRSSAKEMDQILHSARVNPRTRAQRTYRAKTQHLPNWTFVQTETGPAIIRDGKLILYSPERYLSAVNLPKSSVNVLTPKPLVDVLANGYEPSLHFSLKDS